MRHNNSTMPKKVSRIELDAVLQVVTGFPEGISAKKINDTLKISLPHRTLQRRLARLVEENRLIIEGRGRSNRYQLPPGEIRGLSPVGEVTTRGQSLRLKASGAAGTPSVTAKLSVDSYITVSSEGDVSTGTQNPPRNTPLSPSRVASSSVFAYSTASTLSMSSIERGGTIQFGHPMSHVHADAISTPTFRADCHLSRSFLAIPMPPG